MDKNEETGYFYKTIDLADGKYHYQYKIITKSWFEESPQPAKTTIGDEQENSTAQSKINHKILILLSNKIFQMKPMNNQNLIILKHQQLLPILSTYSSILMLLK